MDALILSLIFAAIGFVLALLAKIADKRILVTGAVLFAVYLALDDFVTGLLNLVKALDLIPGKLELDRQSIEPGPFGGRDLFAETFA
jgi:hypothetical protein